VSGCPYGVCDGSGSVLLAEGWRACLCGPALHFRAVHEKAMPYNTDYWEATFDEKPHHYEAESPDQVAALAAAKAYAASWSVSRGPQGDVLCSPKRGLAILGRGCGHGKSHLASAICNDLIERLWTKSIAEVDQNVCLFINVSNWFSKLADFSQMHPALTADMRKSGAEDDPAVVTQRRQFAELSERMKSTKLLVLDDLTVFSDKRTDSWRVLKLYDVVESRVANGMPLIITDNLATWREVEESLGGEAGVRVVDRLTRNCDVVVIGTPKKVKAGRKS